MGTLKPCSLYKRIRSRKERLRQREYRLHHLLLLQGNSRTPPTHWFPLVQQGQCKDLLLLTYGAVGHVFENWIIHESS